MLPATLSLHTSYHIKQSCEASKKKETPPLFGIDFTAATPTEDEDRSLLLIRLFLSIKSISAICDFFCLPNSIVSSVILLMCHVFLPNTSLHSYAIDQNNYLCSFLDSNFVR
ncbi:hypothetical protein L6452_36845 [Arctium lappa]|uniref:Uncharacterized protein n=1 Tax=Arctium lappa TaxID=4217 RepID=A0ACB8Y5I6_ARCLA|nr:hypothetical protein L6452_36845 [Arctium lappa]